MTVYWLMFLFPAVACLTSPTGKYKPDWGLWWVLFIAFVLLMGFRYEVGGDWGNYWRLFNSVLRMEYEDVLGFSDPGFISLVWLIGDWQLHYQYTNFVVAIITCVGLFAFCAELKRPWLALTVSVPYLVIVVGMGYTRQSAALAFCMLGLVALMRRRNFWFVFCVLLGATFHKSAVVLIPIVILATPKGKFWTAIWAGIAGVVAYNVLLTESVDHLVGTYVNSEIQSEGAWVRVLMNMVPAFVFLMNRNKLQLPLPEKNLWTLVSWISLSAVVAQATLNASTAVDRLMLYMIPLQLYVISQLPDMWAQNAGGRRTVILASIVLYALVQFVWLNFATYGVYWVPYTFQFPE